MSRQWKIAGGAVVLRVSGKDARRYLNNRLSNDLRSIAPNSAVAAAALNPQGKVEGLFTVLCEADDRFYLVCDGGTRQAIFAAVGRYIVADRVSIEDLSASASVAHVAGDLAEVQAELSSATPGSAYRVFQSAISPLGLIVISIDAPLSQQAETLTSLWGEMLSQQRYDLLRFSRGVPQYPTEVSEEIVLTESPLAGAVSFSKGCYVGQEVIERSDAIGRLPRHVERIALQGVGPINSGDAVIGKDGIAIGKVVSSFEDQSSQRTFLFALLRTGKYAAREAVTCGALSGYVLLAEEQVL